MKRRGTVLIVDDESYIRDSLAAVFERRGFLARTAAGVRNALTAENLEGVDAVITDLRMPGEDGMELLRSVAAREASLPVIVLTGHGSVVTAVEAMKAGAYEFVQKPADPEALLLLVERAVADATRQRELRYLRARGGAALEGSEPLGVSPAWRAVIELAELAAPTDSSVLLLGESGTGKEEVAKLIHRRGRRNDHAFVRVNCAAIPVDLFESEFFGHRRGSFSGALSDREGRFRIAHEGTLLLDEIACMPESAQAKVLRVLQDGSFDRLGDSHATSVDVRLIAATNADLEAEMRAGRFREDLFYRINVVAIHIPPLRDRIEDLEMLVPHFVSEFAARFAKPAPRLAEDAMSILRAHTWPGNVRELRNILERAVLLDRTGTIRGDQLPLAQTATRAEPRGEPHAKPAEGLNLREAITSEERRVLEEALRRAGGRRREAARLLGVDERNLSYFLKKHSLSAPKRESA